MGLWVLKAHGEVHGTLADPENHNSVYQNIITNITPQLRIR